MIKIILAFLITFILCAVITPLVIRLVKKMQAKQTILKYIAEHKDKQGTPTMGGVGFLVSIIITMFILLEYNEFWVMGMCVGIGFGLIGFLDDFIKVKYKQNLGLRAYQKIIGQLGIASILAFYIYFFSGNGGMIVIPFSLTTINIGWGIIPLVIFVCLALTNAVNLTDGLDGLAGSVTMIFFVAITILLMMYKQNIFSSGADDASISNVYSMAVLSACVAGGLFAFLVFNTYRASIFMGDVGSLGLGGIASAVCCMVGFEFFIPIIGIMYVITTISVALQVLYYKKTKKRIFLMAPLHHHFQMKGHSESKIVFIYSAITLIISLTSILLCLL